MHAVFTMVATAVKSVSTFEDTDPAFTPDAPPLTPTEPALAFIRTSRGRLRTAPRQHDSTDAAICRGVFVGRRAEPPIPGGEIRGASEDRLMPIQGGGPQRDVGGAFRVDVVRRDDRMFRLLNGDELAELVRLRDLALANGLGVRFEEAQASRSTARVVAIKVR